MSREQTLISVIVPAYNASRFLEPAIRSVLEQTHTRLELILVDDGSSDDTAAIAHRLAAEDPRIRLISTENHGVSAARNLAIAQSRGEFIAPMDADDLWHPDKLARQAVLLCDAPHTVGLVYCWCCCIDGQGRVSMPSWTKGTAEGRVLQDIVVDGFVGNGSTPLIRKTALEQVGGYDTNLRLCEDWKLYIALAGVCEFRAVRDYLSAYRLTDSNTSLTAGWESEIAKVTDWIRESWPQLPESAFRRRAFVVNRFLAFLDIRRGAYGNALRHQARAISLAPASLFQRTTIDFIGLLVSHLLGWQAYSWAIFRRRKPFLSPG